MPKRKLSDEAEAQERRDKRKEEKYARVRERNAAAARRILTLQAGGNVPSRPSSNISTMRERKDHDPLLSQPLVRRMIKTAIGKRQVGADTVNAMREFIDQRMHNMLIRLSMAHLGRMFSPVPPDPEKPPQNTRLTVEHLQREASTQRDLTEMLDFLPLRPPREFADRPEVFYLRYTEGGANITSSRRLAEEQKKVFLPPCDRLVFSGAVMQSDL